jgi:hypothetical protein
MEWLKVSIASSFWAYSCTAAARAEEGRVMDDTAMGFAGPDEAWD